VAVSGDWDAVVIGAGVIGLTTAICLQEAGLRVLIRTADRPDRTTSTLASALVGPSFAAPGDRTRAWQAETARRLSPDQPGVSMRRGMMAARPAGAIPPTAAELPGFRLCTVDELPAGYGSGFWVEQPVVDMPPYLAYLSDRFRAGGGDLQVRPVGSLAEAARLAPRVANCSGLGAATLADDPQLTPVRGPKVVVANPGVEHFFMEAPFAPAWAGFIPHGDRVVLGGTRRESADTTPDPAEAAEILRRCALVEPRLAGAPILEHRVGLRPGRPEPRLAAERRDGGLVVHNYGHSGSGVMLSWGCATEAASLLTR
jgi:D-amino-acid oxidase